MEKQKRLVRKNKGETRRQEGNFKYIGDKPMERRTAGNRAQRKRVINREREEKFGENRG
jgi:hypothetical protein